MQLVMQRDRLVGSWYDFKINARLVLVEDESLIIGKYKLRDVSLIEGDPWRDMKRAAWIAVPLAALLSYILAFFNMPGIGINIPTFIVILVISYGLIYAQIREEVIVKDLLNGREFKARSLVSLLNKEHEIRKMSDVFERIIDQARTWQEPEVIDLKEEPYISVDEEDHAVA
jgi:hypothetical protein